ncbi:hypothetical protein AMS68_007854 [Peltaster fructicola]|uniref:Uncharacterized protein n=1 Tax=Peltaster fructicola TaxID=286661 RepID=A0A6H0Y5L0_9PEZI|nr:hypothetical protein AMS68_007854 [Peltaster fructicola]
MAAVQRAPAAQVWIVGYSLGQDVPDDGMQQFVAYLESKCVANPTMYAGIVSKEVLKKSLLVKRAKAQNAEKAKATSVTN